MVNCATSWIHSEYLSTLTSSDSCRDGGWAIMGGQNGKPQSKGQSSMMNRCEMEGESSKGTTHLACAEEVEMEEVVMGEVVEEDEPGG